MEGLCSLVSMNISGRFTGREIKQYGQEVIKHILQEKSVALFFGQQTNFRPQLPDGYDYIGGSKAFLVYNTNEILAGDEKHYKWYLRDLELQDRLPKNYLPETNYIICKMKLESVGFEFIAMSWVTDECVGKHKSLSLFKKLCLFIENLSEIEDIPILLSGSFRINAEDAKKYIPTNFRCCSYVPMNRRRSMRQSNFYICTRSLTFTDLKPMVCGRLDIELSNTRNGKNAKLINPEDVFYWDPVVASLHSRQNLFFHDAAVKLDEYIKQQNGTVVQDKDDGNDKHADEPDSAVTDTDLDSSRQKLQKATSFVELYDEEVMQNTGVCYMQ